MVKKKRKKKNSRVKRTEEWDKMSRGGGGQGAKAPKIANDLSFFLSRLAHILVRMITHIFVSKPLYPVLYQAQKKCPFSSPYRSVFR